MSDPSPPPPAMGAIVSTHLFLLNEQQLNGAVRIHKQFREAHKFLEDVFKSAAFGRFATAELISSVICQLYDPLFSWYRIHQPHGVVNHELLQLSFYSSKVSRLYLHKEIIADNVNDESVNRYLKPVVRLLIPLPQSLMKRLLVQRTNPA